MERFMKHATRKGIIIGVPILSVVIISSLLYYISVWYGSQKLLVINSANVSGYAILVLAVFLSTMVNIGLTIYYSSSLKKIEKLVVENCTLSELVLQMQMKSNNEVMNAIKGGGKFD